MELRVIAIDFDGCLCENKWPKIGKPIKQTFQRALVEREQGSKLILWTCRTDKLLVKAVKWCRAQGLIFDTVNEQLPELLGIYGTDSRKIYATEYWDDKAVKMPQAIEEDGRRLLDY